MSRGGNIIDMLHDCEVSQFGKVHESSVNDKPKGWTSFGEGFKSGDRVQIHTDSDGWFGEYEFVRDASDKDLRDLSMNYLKDYKGKKYVVKNVHKGMFFGDLGIVTDKNIRKVSEGVYEDDWKTMHGAHILVDDKSNIKAGGPKRLRKSVDAKSSGVKKRDMKDYDNPDNLKDLRNNSETAKKYGFLKSGKDNGRLDDMTCKDDIDKEAATKFIDDMADKYDEGKSGKPSDDEIECMKALVRNNALSKEDKDFVKTNFLGM